MLTPEYLQKIVDGSEDIASELHAIILAKIIERYIARMEMYDDLEFTGTDKFQIEVLTEAGYLFEEIQAEIAKITNRQLEEIRTAFEDAGIEAFNYDTGIYQSVGLLPPSTPVTLDDGIEAMRPPMELTQSPYYLRLMQRNYEATAGQWRNYTGTFASAAYSTFVSECDAAYNLTALGAVSMSEAVRDAVARIAHSGVTIEYKDAEDNITRRDSIETATARAVRTGVGQACADITDARLDEMEWDIILTSAHIGARYGDGGQNHTNHAWWQGKFYSRSGDDKQFPPFSVCGRGKAGGICGINCRHSYGPGDGENNPFDPIDTEENKKAYDLSQRQRALERKIRNNKRELAALQTGIDATTDDETRAKLAEDFVSTSVLLERRNEAYKEFCADNNLKTRYERMEAAQWDRELARKVRKAVRVVK